MCVESHRQSGTHQARLPLLPSRWPRSTSTQTEAAENIPQGQNFFSQIKTSGNKRTVRKIQHQCPSEFSYRKSVKEIFEKKQWALKAKLKSKKMSIQCDESEVNDNKLVHIWVSEVDERPFLVTSKCLDTTN